MAPRLPESLLPPVDELSRLFSEATGDPETLDKRDRLLISVWESKIRPKVLQRAESPTAEPHRWKLPDERQSMTARFEIPTPGGESEDKSLIGYITTGMYDDEYVGEIFLTMAKQGSFVRGIMDAFVTSVSIGLQHGIPLETFARKFKHTGFQPAGMVIGAPTGMQGFFKSVLDYLFQYLEHRFPGGRLPPKEALLEPDQSAVAESATEASAGAESATEASTEASKPESETEASDGAASDVATSAAES